MSKQQREEGDIQDGLALWAHRARKCTCRLVFLFDPKRNFHKKLTLLRVTLVIARAWTLRPRGNGSARTRIPGGPPRRGRACRTRTSARARDRPRARPPRLLRLPDSARPKMRTCATARRPTRRRPSAPWPPRSSPSRGTRTSTRSLTSGASRTRTCSACTRDAAANGSAVGATDFTTRRRRRRMRREARLVKKEPKPSFSSRTGARTPR
jgi:hypothetical protein